MRIAIIGPGAVGSLYAAYLKNGGLDVTLIDHNSDRAKSLSQSGLHIQGVRGTQQLMVPVTVDAANLGPVDLVIVCVKAYHTETAIKQHQALVDKQSTIWTLQNGLGNIEALCQVIPRSQVVGGSTVLGVNLEKPGVINHAGEGESWIGELDQPSSQRVNHIAEILNQAGMSVQVSPNIHRQIWSKLLINVGINALTAILQVPNGALAQHAAPKKLMQGAVHEALQAAQKQGISFDEVEIQSRVLEIAQKTANNRSSMLVDILSGRKTEVEYINGAICKIISAPINQTITNLVCSMEETQAERRQLQHECLGKSTDSGKK